MKKFLSLILALVMTCSLIACGAKEEAPAAKEETKTEAPAKTETKTEAPAANDFTIDLKLGHGNATEHAIHVYTQQWADAVAEATDGRIKITIYPAGQLGSLAEMLEAVEYGTLDMTLGDTSLLSNSVPAYGLFSLPFFVDDYEVAAKFYDGEVGQAIAQDLIDATGIRPLGYYWNGMRQMAARTPITSVADCANIKARSPEATLYMDMFNLLGMKPTPLPWGETYTAVESGVVDGLETTTEAMCTQGFHKLTNNVTITNHMVSVVGPVIADSVWQKIPAEDQQLMMDLLAEAVAAQRADVSGKEAGYIETMAAEANVAYFENPAELVELFTPYWSEYAEANGCVEYFEQCMALK